MQTTLQQNIDGSVAVTRSLAALETQVRLAAQIITDCLSSGHKLLVCGNGGSAADASHLACEFVSRFLTERRSYPAISLNDSGSTLTAIGNDYAFEEVFARQVRGFGQPGDVLVVFTTSGRSPDIIAALRESTRGQLKSIAFLGRDGGLARGLATVELIVASDITARIQEGHQVLYHTICEMADTQLAGA
jgi:phosphoheptose isomerase